MSAEALCRSACLAALLVSALAGAAAAGEAREGPSRGGPNAVNVTTPAGWLRAQAAPRFRDGHGLPPLTRFGWTLPVDARIELAERWGYCLEFGGYATETLRRDPPGAGQLRRTTSAARPHGRR